MQSRTVGTQKQLAGPHGLTIQPRHRRNRTVLWITGQRCQPLERCAPQRRGQWTDGRVRRLREFFHLFNDANVQVCGSSARRSRRREVTHHGREVFSATQPSRREQCGEVLGRGTGRDPQRHSPAMSLVTRDQRAQSTMGCGLGKPHHDAAIPPCRAGMNQPGHVGVFVDLGAVNGAFRDKPLGVVALDEQRQARSCSTGGGQRGKAHRRLAMNQELVSGPRPNSRSAAGPNRPPPHRQAPPTIPASGEVAPAARWGIWGRLLDRRGLARDPEEAAQAGRRRGRNSTSQ